MPPTRKSTRTTRGKNYLQLLGHIIPKRPSILEAEKIRMAMRRWDKELDKYLRQSTRVTKRKPTKKTAMPARKIKKRSLKKKSLKSGDKKCLKPKEKKTKD